MATIRKIRAELARRRLIDFIEFTMPLYQTGWFHRDLAATLEQFLGDVIARKSPRLIITAPPRSGKSQQVSRHLPAWAFGKYPDLSIIGASYAASLARRMNRDIQRIIDTPEYREVFPDTVLPSRGTKAAQVRNVEQFEILDHTGGYRGVGVGQGITGMGCDILNIDDPVKDAKEAQSKVFQEAVYEWYTSTAYTRLAPGGGVLLTMTRWDENDLAGKILDAAKPGEWNVIRYPAIAEVDEKYRRAGEALHPERYDVDALRDIEETLGSYYWGALYQGHPAPRKGGFFDWERIEVVDKAPPGLTNLIRYWDKAGTDGAGCYTAGVKIGYDPRVKRWYVLDVVRGQWSAGKREVIIKSTADLDGPDCVVWIEREGGSGGKESASNTIVNLAGYSIRAESPTGSKEARALGYSAQIEAGNVSCVRGSWTQAFIDEHKTFPTGKYKDQIDAAAGAFNKTIATKKAGSLL